MKKVTKSQIVKVLRTQNVTEIFKIAKLHGVDVSNRENVFNFIQKFAPSQKVYNNAYSLSYGASNFKNYRIDHSTIHTPIANVVRFAKKSKKRQKDNYTKVLIIGDTNIYWASPVYGFKDYNKSFALKNTLKNRGFAQKVNAFIGVQA